MRAEDLITSSKEAFGQHPEDVLAPAKMAAKGFGWLNEIFVSIQREAEGDNCPPRRVDSRGRRGSHGHSQLVVVAYSLQRVIQVPHYNQ